ncbi:M55 family metallopeptidase [Laceyella putida]|uniref:M55 family metallopeptidase n=1 Tax=Laceyella putida TaxID=110101 RepID=A0ABW2RPC3_9BACL
MKLYISVDMEGISGIHDRSYILPDRLNYQRGRQLMTEDVNVVVETALACGAREIVVADSHFEGNNLLIERLHPQARLISGFQRSGYMMHGLDGSYDGVLLLGYHARSGASGLLSHTMTPIVRNCRINGQVVGEFGLNAIYAGLFDVPVWLVSGDDQLALEAKQLVPTVHTAVVKETVSWQAAKCLPLEESRAVLRRRTQEAIQRRGEGRPLKTSHPLEMKVEFSHRGQAEMAALLPQAELDRETTVTISIQQPQALLTTLGAMLALAGQV